MKSDLSRDLRMRRPFESAEQEAFLLLQRLTSELTHAANGLLKRHGLSSPQYNVLRILRGAGRRARRAGRSGSAWSRATPT